MFDFVHNNKQIIDHLGIWNLVEKFDTTALYFAILTLHNDDFSRYLNSVKAIACIIVARDLILSYCDFSQETDDFLKEWIIFLIRESRHDPNEINDVYMKINDFYQHYDTLGFINSNLSKLYPLKFD